MSWRVPIVLTVERNCATAADAAEAAELAMDCLPDGYGMSYVIGVPAPVTGPVCTASLQNRRSRFRSMIWQVSGRIGAGTELVKTGQSPPPVT